MRQFWSVTIATFLLLGFAGVTMGAAISERQAEGHQGRNGVMSTAEHDLACVLRR